ncbi:Di-copper centre-containing protein [Periconia macrospinosa]|uniref:Di-copper centre-containing protein n=1 Tax=Periconia macrospinosa TaxID=97972 RepID=A0A2V1DGW1_9PLEO|nr:Di-copper centre-containing protein [Periconia macrospinosa]
MVRTSLLFGACALLGSNVVTAVPAPDIAVPNSAVLPSFIKKRSCHDDDAGAKNKTGIPPTPEFVALAKKYTENTLASLKGNAKCTPENIAVRKSWDEIDDETRLDYIRAVKCLAAKPARTDKNLAPGAVNRLDDFTYIHINQTNIIHNSGYLLPWHRIFLNQFETAMREECGYKSWLPYWDNTRFSEDPTASKVWDGSETSFGGNGIYLENDHGPYKAILPGLSRPFTLPKPAGTGGGCITTGPFVNFTISLGPVALETIDPNNVFGLKPNPRCLQRNFDPKSSIGFLTWANATKVIGSPDIAQHRNNMDLLWHKNSHTFIGKDGADPFSTTNDPAFYLLHAQIDRLYAMWQGQDLENRKYAIDGNRTFMGIPLEYAPDVQPSLAQIEDVMDLGLGVKPTVKETMSATENGMCFMYQ